MDDIRTIKGLRNLLKELECRGIIPGYVSKEYEDSIYGYWMGKSGNIVSIMPTRNNYGDVSPNSIELKLVDGIVINYEGKIGEDIPFKSLDNVKDSTRSNTVSKTN